MTISDSGRDASGRGNADFPAAAGFFVSGVFFSLLTLLNAWGNPEGFSSFPLSSALLFCDSLRLYSLSCFLYFSLGLFLERRFRGPRGRTLRFLLSFWPVFAFAVLVLLKTRLETAERVLRTFEMLLLSAACGAAFLFLKTPGRDERLRPGAFAALGAWGTAVLAFAVREAGFDSWFLPGFLQFLFFLGTALRAASVFGRSAAGVVFFGEDLSAFGLSEREREVAVLLAEGKTNREIAEALFISLATVKTHLSNIFGKTGARNRTEAAAAFRKTAPPEE